MHLETGTKVKCGERMRQNAFPPHYGQERNENEEEGR